MEIRLFSTTDESITNWMAKKQSSFESWNRLAAHCYTKYHWEVALSSMTSIETGSDHTESVCKV